MPTRTSQKNPKGLSQVAKFALEVQPKVSSILERLSKDDWHCTAKATQHACSKNFAFLFNMG